MAARSNAFVRLDCESANPYRTPREAIHAQASGRSGAQIGGNAASIGLDRSQGFEPAGLLKPEVGKFGSWVDSALMQRPLNCGDTAPPDRY